MTKSKVILALAIVVALLSCLFAGCGIPQEESISPEEYERVNAELRESQAQVAELQDEIRGLKEQYEIVGETPTETAENIVKRYYETHIYSVYELNATMKHTYIAYMIFTFVPIWLWMFGTCLKLKELMH